MFFVIGRLPAGDYTRQDYVSSPRATFAEAVALREGLASATPPLEEARIVVEVEAGFLSRLGDEILSAASIGGGLTSGSGLPGDVYGEKRVDAATGKVTVEVGAWGRSAQLEVQL